MAGFWKKKKVLVTGANGFIGAWVCHSLVDEGANVIGLVHGEHGLLESHGIEKKVKQVRADIRDAVQIEKAFDEHKPELCFHLAAKSSTRDAAIDTEDTFKTNVGGTLNVLDAAKNTGAGVVFVSSVKVYGGFTENCFDEGQLLNGKSTYAISKVATEAVCRMFADSFGLSVGIARPGNVFGGHDNNFARLVPGVIKKAMDGKSPEVIGKGESLLDFIYVEDLVQGMLKLGEKTCSEKLNAEAFNFGSGGNHSVKELVESIIELVGADVKIAFSGEENVCQEKLCIKKPEKELGWKPKNDLKKGLEKTVAYFKALS